MRDRAEITGIVMSLEGKTIEDAMRAVYRHRGEVVSVNGPLEIKAGDRRLVLSSGGDGESLVAHEGGWRNPYGGMSREASTAFIEEYGHYELTRDETGARSLVGVRVLIVDLVVRREKLVGLVLRTPAGRFLIDADGDELSVDALG